LEGSWGGMSSLYKLLTQHNVTQDLVIGHLDMANSNAEAQDLLELELDGWTDFRDLVGEVLSVGNRCGELASCERL